MKEKKHKLKAAKPETAKSAETDSKQSDSVGSNNDQTDVDPVDDDSSQDFCSGEIVEDSNEDGGKSKDKDAKIDELTNRWMRTMAEFDNFRKRTIKEKASMYDDGVRDAVQKLLPIIDNFERALGSESEKASGFYKGIDMIAKQITEYLTDLGVTEIPGAGESFDPNVHFAVTHVEDDSVGENTVVEVLQKGYIHKEKVIRPAMVKVAN